MRQRDLMGSGMGRRWSLVGAWLLAVAVACAPVAAWAGEAAGAQAQKKWNPLAEGLQWLAKAQEEDGYWDASKYQGKAETAAVTSLALLAFLGNGNSANKGKYKRVVRAGQEWLGEQYRPGTRHVGDYGFTAPLALMALAEGWIMIDCKDEDLRLIVEDMAKFAVESQSANGGWGAKPLKDPAAAKVDCVTSSRWVMALKDATIAGVKLDSDAWSIKARQYFDGVAQATIAASANPATGDRDRLADQAAVALASLQFLNQKRDDASVKGCTEALFRNEWLPGQKNGYDGVANDGKTDYCGWYYQSLGLIQYGPESEEWKTFSSRIGNILFELQEKQDVNRGSWASDKGRDGPDGFEAMVGRVGVTAIGCMIMEIYYRFGARPAPKR